MDLKTKYLGLELKNPIIVGASNLVTDIDMLKKLEEAGAAAIVYKSLFEGFILWLVILERIQLENLEMGELLTEYEDRFGESTSMFHSDLYETGPEQFLMNFKEAKEVLSIPLIASLNAVNDDTWYEYAKKLEEAGATVNLK